MEYRALRKRHLFIWLLLVGSLMLLATCREGDRPIQQHAPAPTDEKAVLRTLNHLLDVTYDDPQQVVNAPDTFMNQVKTMPTSAIGQESYTWLLLNVAYVLREHGDVLRSIQYYERAWAYCTEHAVKNLDQVLYMAKPLANLYTRIDDIEKSIALHQRAIRIAKETGKKAYLPALYNNLALAYQQKDWVDSVYTTVHRGLMYTATDSAVTALLYNTLSQAYMDSHLPDSASLYNKRALAILQQSSRKQDTLLWYAEALRLKSELDAGNEHRVEAIAGLTKAISMVDAHFPRAKNREKAKYWVARGDLQVKEKPEEAISNYHRALWLLQGDTTWRYVSDYTYTHALHGLARSFETKDTDSCLYYYQKTIENDFQTQQLIVSKASNYKNSRWNRQILEEYLAILWNHYEAEVNEMKRQAYALQMLWAIELSKARQLLTERKRSDKWEQMADGEVQVVKEQLRQLNHMLVTTTDPQRIQDLKSQIADLKFQFQLDERYFEQQFSVVDLADFKRFLLQASYLKSYVSYFINEAGNSFIVTVSHATATSLRITREQWQAMDVSGFITRYFAHDPHVYEQNPRQYARASMDLLNRLLPIDWERDTSIVLSLDGLLFRLPMDACMRDGRFIAEDHAIGYSYSLLLDYQQRRSEAQDAEILLFAKAKHGDGFPDLHFVDAERKWIASHYRSRVFANDQATREALLNHLSTPGILHLATHVVAHGDSEPYLVLDNKLTLDALAYVPMRSALVVLSACESAQGAIVASEGLESLNKAFLSKGVAGVIAAQWPVDDQVAAQLMQLFYEALDRCGHPAKALLQAKRQFLQQNKGRYRNPWYWASLNYVGTDTAIHIHQTYRRFWELGGIVVMVVLGLVWGLKIIKKRGKSPSF